MNILLERDFCSWFFWMCACPVQTSPAALCADRIGPRRRAGGRRRRRRRQPSVLPGSRGGSGAVRRDAVTPDLYSITLCCCGWHKRKTQSDLIGCDWSCSAFPLKPCGTLIFVAREKQEIPGKGRGERFHGLEMGEHHKASYKRCWHICSRSLLFSCLWETSHFFSPLLSLSVLPLSFHPSGICVGGIKVVLLSSKLQISFASVHLTLCFITVARGATRFSSPPLQSNNSYQPLFHSSTHYLLHYYYYSILGVGGIIFMALALLGCTAETDRKASSGRMWHATYVMSRDQTDKVVIVALSPPRPGAERADADSVSRAPPILVLF